MFQAQAKAVLRRDGGGVMEIGAHDMGQGAWTALAQIAADGLGLDIDQVEFRSGTSDLPDAGIAGGSAHTATAGMAIHNAGADVIARLADLATNDDRSPLFGAGNAGVIARDGRLFRRDDESRSESYADILARAGLAQIEGHGTSAADPAAQSTYAMHAHGAVFAEVKVDPDLGQIRATRRGRRVRRRTDHQSPHGAQPALWRHDLGRVVRPARARRHGSRARAG